MPKPVAIKDRSPGLDESCPTPIPVREALHGEDGSQKGNKMIIGTVKKGGQKEKKKKQGEASLQLYDLPGELVLNCLTLGQPYSVYHYVYHHIWWLCETHNIHRPKGVIKYPFRYQIIS